MNRSTRFAPRDVTAGADVEAPPMASHEPHDVVNVRRQIAPSPPRTNTSILPGAFDTEAGAEVAPPGGAPIEAHVADQVLPLRKRCSTWSFAPRTNASTIAVPCRTDAAGLA